MAAPLTNANGLPDASARQYSTLREWAYWQIREMIVDGQLAQGTDIHEGQLSSLLKISKSPLREALRELTRDGLVDALPNKGVYVSRLTEADIEEIYELREATEVVAVRLACARRTPEGVAQLRANVAAQDAARLGGSRREIADNDVEFHLMLARIAGNSRLVRVTRSIQTEMLRLIMQQFTDWGDEAALDAVIKHRNVVDSIEAADAEAAVSHILTHLHRGRTFRRDAAVRDAEPPG